jgi:hypothetical protein
VAAPGRPEGAEVMKNVTAWAITTYSWLALGTAVVLGALVGCGRPAMDLVAPNGTNWAPQARQDRPSSTDVLYLDFALGRLHRHAQPNGPVGVVWGSPEELAEAAGGAVWAYTERCGAGWLIHMSTDLHGEMVLNVIEHEWAHTLSWGEFQNAVQQHGPQWGIELSRAFVAVVYNSDLPDSQAVPVSTSPIPADEPGQHP